MTCESKNTVWHGRPKSYEIDVQSENSVWCQSLVDSTVFCKNTWIISGFFNRQYNRLIEGWTVRLFLKALEFRSQQSGQRQNLWLWKRARSQRKAILFSKYRNISKKIKTQLFHALTSESYVATDTDLSFSFAKFTSLVQLTHYMCHSLSFVLQNND